MPSVPKRGDIVHIKRDLSGSSFINERMKQYQGKSAKVLAVTECGYYIPSGAGFAVRLDIDNGNWHWYGDAIVLDPDDEFMC